MNDAHKVSTVTQQKDNLVARTLARESKHIDLSVENLNINWDIFSVELFVWQYEMYPSKVVTSES